MYKKLIITICMSIILTGSYTPEQKKIVDKYSSFVSAKIPIEITSEPLTHNGNMSAKALTYFSGPLWDLKPTKIKVNKNIDTFEHTLVHEIGHFILPHNNKMEPIDRENWANKYADDLIKYVKTLGL